MEFTDMMRNPRLFYGDRSVLFSGNLPRGAYELLKFRSLLANVIARKYFAYRTWAVLDFNLALFHTDKVIVHSATSIRQLTREFYF